MGIMPLYGTSFGLLAAVGILVVMLGLLLRRFKQPYLIGYILIGVLMGDHGLGYIANNEMTVFMGEMGIIFLFFYIGMEISLPEFIKQWKIALWGTLAQILISVGIVLLIGRFFGWNTVRSVVLGFVIALSSSAVIIKLLADKGLVNTKIGKDVLSILLAQDIAIAPLLIITSFLGGEPESTLSIALKIIGGVLIILLIFYLYVNKCIRLPFNKSIKKDHELQVFLALFFCFGGALLADLFGLSSALGAFVGGMVIHAAKSTEWIFDSLHSFRIIFVAVFFISIGLQIDLVFIWDNMAVLSLVLLAVYTTNHFLNSAILKFFSNSWKEALIGGALLAQIGEMSFLICSTAYNSQIIMKYTYDFTLCLISLTLVISPFWIAFTEFAMEKIYKAQ